MDLDRITSEEDVDRLKNVDEEEEKIGGRDWDNLWYVKGGYGQLWRDGGIVTRRDNKIERWGESREDRR